MKDIREFIFIKDVRDFALKVTCKLCCTKVEIDANDIENESLQKYSLSFRCVYCNMHTSVNVITCRHFKAPPACYAPMRRPHNIRRPHAMAAQKFNGKIIHRSTIIHCDHCMTAYVAGFTGTKESE